MPHCVVEHSPEIDSDVLVQVVFKGALKSKLFEADGSDIKVRAITYGDYLTGLKESGFIHVALKILSGRTNEQKLALSKLVVAEIESLALSSCSITVEVVDIDCLSYSKVVC